MLTHFAERSLFWPKVFKTKRYFNEDLLLKPLVYPKKIESTVTENFLRTTAGQNSTPEIRKLLSFPLHLRGLNIQLTDDNLRWQLWSIEKSNCMNSDDKWTFRGKQELITKRAKLNKIYLMNNWKKTVLSKTYHSKKQLLMLATEKVPTNYLNALPLAKYQFDLSKEDFRDGLVLLMNRI